MAYSPFGPSAVTWLPVVLALLFTGQASAQVIGPGETGTFSLVASTDKYKLSSSGFPRLTFNPTGTRLAVSTSILADGSGHVIFLSVPDLGTVRDIRLDTQPSSITFSPQGDFLGLSMLPKPGGDNIRFAMLSTSKWTIDHVERGLRYPVNSLAFDPVGDLLFVGSSDVRELYRFEAGTWRREQIPALLQSETGCQSLTVSPDGRFGAMGTVGSGLHLWELDDSAPVAKLGTREFRGAVTAVAFSHDSGMLAAGDTNGKVMVFYRTADNLWAWKALFNLTRGWVTGLALLNDGSLITANPFGEVSRWNPENTVAPLESIQLGVGNTEAIAVDPTGRWLGTAGNRLSLYSLLEQQLRPATVTPPPVIVQTISTPPLHLGTATVQQPAPPVVQPPPPQRGVGNGDFFIWVAPSEAMGDAEDWIQAWASGLDAERYPASQVLIPYESLDLPAVEANLNHLGELLDGNDFLVSYVAATLSATKEENSFGLAVGPDPSQSLPLSMWIQVHEVAAQKAAVIWFLDIRPDPTLDEAETQKLMAGFYRHVALQDGIYSRSTKPIGVGLITYSKDYAHAEMAGHLSDGLAGKADTNGDGRIIDRELLNYLLDHIRSAKAFTPIGNATHEVPALLPTE